MKIIDNKKDYYDYLMGVLGQDELVVYDRRGSQMVNISSHDIDYPNWKSGCPDLVYILWIGDEYRVIEHNGKDWMCDSQGKPVSTWPSKEFRQRIPRISKDPIELIIMTEKWDYWWGPRKLVHISNPILRELAIVRRYIPAEFIWNSVYNYICKQKEKEIVDTRTDVQKAESYGFDKKTSFRNVK